MVATRSRKSNTNAKGSSTAIQGQSNTRDETETRKSKSNSKKPTATNAKRPSGIVKKTSEKTATTKGPKRHQMKSKSSSEDTESATQKESKPNVAANSENVNQSGRPNYWLMKAEPESRIENGIDVKFSIDDLAAASEPEPWDGVRNYGARNNMMNMKKGNLGFFYHSNCKVPGIAGILKIAKEADVDESAFDSKHPYYDEKSSRDKPRWYCVRVVFHKKFDNLIPLKELQAVAKEPETAISDMQLFRQSRLSVQRVTPHEWDFIISRFPSS